jgi:hypothetical protein
MSSESKGCAHQVLAAHIYRVFCARRGFILWCAGIAQELAVLRVVGGIGHIFVNAKEVHDEVRAVCGLLKKLCGRTKGKRHVEEQVLRDSLKG